ncbi:restriction endonuclease subunit S [Granulicatella sp. HMSC31F03]|uniref:restriction endonuclease subunit S n=1 Tax=Granulicatella sp. HMSC31F03 TaxID=1581074 RepID=UPI0008A1F476|nr:restriction endonuclease subunit S [Granulicatella sp. HMSC31F03]OFT00933.1 hypothetical protein HMPREF3106_04880 [Granulicatella sp. HMSC31F03]
MTPEQLKASILQRAMEGNLVPQDPNDEPASELLKRIKAEKEKLIKEGKIKRDKNETEIFRGDDGLNYEKFPDGTIERLIFDFDIPDTWELTRLRNIGNIISGGTPKTTEKSYYNGNIPWITPSDMGKQQNRIYFGRASKFISDIGLNNSSAQMIPANSIVYSSRAPIGHINIVNTEFTTNQGCKSIYPLFIDNEFLYWLLKNRTTDIQQRSSGTTFKEISGRSFGDTIVCIPPYQEQKRITRKISSILKNINNYEKYYAELEQLKKDFPEKLRKSILQYAMQGKLVPQNVTDEPVEVLLEKIREEKQRLFEEGKLKKKDLQESIIYQGDDNSYYENKFPKNWIITTLCNMGDISTGNTPSKNNYSYWSNGTIPFFKPADLVQKKNMHTASEYLSVEGFKKARYVEKDSILVNGIGNIGVTGIVKKEGAFNQQMHSVKPYNYIDSDFLFYLFNTNFVQEQMINNSSSTTIPILNKKKFSELIGVFPSLQEQKRIVSRIEKINFLIKKI